MAPPRLVSLYKNQTVSPFKREQWHSELNLSLEASDFTLALRCSTTHVIAKSSTLGSLATLPLEATGKKHAHQPPETKVSSKAILDFGVEEFREPLLAVAQASEVAILDHQFQPQTSLATSASAVKWHPHFKGLLLSYNNSAFNVWDAERSSPAASAGVQNLSDAVFLPDALLATTSKGVVQIWDVRTQPKAVQEAPGHLGIKSSHISALGPLLLTTGTNRTRDREYMLRDPRMLNQAIKTQRLDTSTGPLFPLVDPIRRMAYLAGRGDMFLNWLELGENGATTEGTCNLPQPIFGAALSPPVNLQVMQTEINRLYVSTRDGNIFGLSAAVPRRQYLDFHSDLFPPVYDLDPVDTAPAWLQGSSSIRPTVPTTAAGTTFSSLPSQPKVTKQPDQIQATPEPIPSKAVPPPAPETRPSTFSEPAALPAVTPSPISQAPPSVISPASPRNAPKPADYSRNFLIGKTPLKPAYESVTMVNTVTKPDMPVLLANSKLLAFPLAGPGGRLVTHATSDQGRMPSVPSHVECASGLTAFELDPFDLNRVYAACEDGKIRVFEADSSALVAELTDPKMDHIQELRSHPSASDLLLSLSEDSGQPTLRLWSSAEKKVKLTVPLASSAYSSAWNANGSLVAVAYKNKQIEVFDARLGQMVAKGPAHASTRTTKVVWVDDSHLISSGFSRTADREVILHQVAGSDIKPMGKVTLDVSPAPLFPVYDADTSILFLYGKGETAIHAFEVRPKEGKLTRLPSYSSGVQQLGVSFLPKTAVDAYAVEVAIAYRLTTQAIEKVTFSIPRARVEYFQDDVFPDTVDNSKPSMTADEWLAGSNASQARVSLNTKGLPLLSQAPPTKAQISTRDKIAAGPELTETQKNEAYLDRLFQKAKIAESDDEEDAKPPPPEDDDW